MGSSTDPGSQVTLMSHQFDFDSAHRILRCRFHGPVGDEEIKSYYREAGTYGKGPDALAAGITDFSGVTLFDVSRQTVLELASCAPALADPKAIRIIIAPTPVVFGMARMFEISGERTRPNLHVVKTEQEAWAILGVWKPRFEPLERMEG